MKLPKILEVLTRTPLPMAPGSAESILMLFQQHAMLNAADFRAAREGKDFCGSAIEIEQMTVDGGLAMIPVKGPLGINLGPFEKGAGATDYADIQKELAEANENPAVENILLVMDTPGGMWGGLPETSKAIANSAKPVFAYVPPGGMCASAGMHLAAPCAGRLISPSAQVGSIGVYCAYMDMSKMAEDRGIKVKVFSSGDYKGMGVPGTSLTPDQEQLLQDQVMELADEFYGHIRKHLGDVPDEAMQGQMFRSERAVELGLADAVVESMEEMKTFLR